MTRPVSAAWLRRGLEMLQTRRESVARLSADSIPDIELRIKNGSVIRATPTKDESIQPPPRRLNVVVQNAAAMPRRTAPSTCASLTGFALKIRCEAASTSVHAKLVTPRERSPELKDSSPRSARFFAY